MVLFALALVTGCGRRGNPLPPGLRLPAAPTQVTLDGRGGRLRLAWKAPREDRAGRAMDGVSGYLIQREALGPGSEPCVGCPERFGEVARVDVLERRSRGEPETRWVDREAVSGWTYRYRVLALDPQNRPGSVSATVGITWHHLPDPLVEAVPGDGEAILGLTRSPWPDDVDLMGTRVYDGAGNLLAETAVGASQVRVVGLQNDIEVTLSVHDWGRSAAGWPIESPGVPIRLTPRDTTAPIPPSDLVAVAVAAGVQLRWLPAGREAYAEVIILRGGEGEVLVEIGRVPGRTFAYLDRSAAPGQTLRYAVTAVDARGNRSLATREVRIQVP